MSAKKTSFYHTRNRIIPNKALTAELLGVDVSEIERMDIEGAPVMAERLLLLWDQKYIHVPGWDGWLFSRGVLRFKNHQWRPDNLLQLRNYSNKLCKLENDLKSMFSFSGFCKIGFHLCVNCFSKLGKIKIKLVIT